ncbi:MAG: cation-translocating P-type ATPase [Firmicutes bacterium]|nr:cation-translocating P-type ATPase [Bacillota bacterium]
MDEFLKTNPETGLTSEEVRVRVEAGKANIDDTGKTKTIRQIVISNICTLFNLVNLILAVAVILVGSYKNATFMGVIIANTAIGIFQEIRSKKAMDRLAFLSASRVRVIRDGQETDILPEEVVEGDLMILSAGKQIQADAVVISGSAHVDESFITGEPDAIDKEPGDEVMAGSFVNSGRCIVQAVKVGRDKYISTISSGAKSAKDIRSEIMNSLKWIVRVVSIILVPVGIAVFVQQMHLDGATLQKAVVSTTASLIGMIPEGLMLLTSTALAVSVVRLSKENVMVQQLYCIETLARVDTLCLDKTGTLTEGSLEVVDTLMFGEQYSKWIPNAVVSVIRALPDPNATSQAILEKYPGAGDISWRCTKAVPFSSKTKWSGASFEGQGTFCFGAAEFLYPHMPDSLYAAIDKLAQQYRVLLIVHSNEPFRGEDLPPEESLEPVGVILLRDKVRKEAAKTLAYFKEQGVNIKIISGDSPQTVAGIAKFAGVENWDSLVDATTLKTDEEVAEAAGKYTVFGRVTPQQKKQLIEAMQSEGHTVAMTGDGVNDVLALKQADCSIAMASGTDAARNVAELVLLKSNFDAMPRIVDEGRRSINNVQRSAALFLTKTVYSILLAVLFVFIPMRYPFMPIQMSLISTTCIGVPGFFMALQPNHERVKGHFMKNVMLQALPGGLSVVLNLCFIIFFSGRFNLPSEFMSTLCVMAAGFTSLLTLYRISKPFNLLRTVVYIVMVILLSVGIFFFPDFFGLQHFSWELFVFMLIFLMAGYGLFNIMFNIFHDRTDMIANFRGWLAEQKAWFREKKWKKKKTG